MNIRYGTIMGGDNSAGGGMPVMADPITGEYPNSDNPNRGANVAGVFSSLFSALGQIGVAVANAVGGGSSSPGGPGGGTGVTVVQPPQAGMSPMMLAAIGIPAALIAVALLKRK